MSVPHVECFAFDSRVVDGNGAIGQDAVDIRKDQFDWLGYVVIFGCHSGCLVAVEYRDCYVD